MMVPNDLFDNLAIHRPWEDKDWGLAEARTRSMFNPSSPVDVSQLFSGRKRQIEDALSVVYERGAHGIIFGERGVGKSSLANTISGMVPAQVANIRFLKENCRPEDTFFGIWSKILWNFQYEGIEISEYLKNETREFIVLKILESLPKEIQFVFIFDEFDRIKGANIKSAMADTIKQLSDYPQNLTIFIVGVGSSIDELFGAHPSIQRCCRQIPMQRMSNPEMYNIIDSRYSKIGVSIGDEVRTQIVDLCQGMPGFVHLSAREACLSAIHRKSRNVENYDYKECISESVRMAQESIINSYKKATYSPKENIYAKVLLACALAERDEQGKFSASSIRDSLKKNLDMEIEISGFSRHLAAFCDEERGAVLRKTGKPRRFQYQFIDAPLQPYIVMVGKRDGLI